MSYDDISTHLIFVTPLIEASSKPTPKFNSQATKASTSFQLIE